MTAPIPVAGALAPATGIGADATYRLTVTNTGDADLVNVVVNDAELGIVNFPVGDLPAGQTVVLTSSQIPALAQPGRCQVAGHAYHFQAAVFDVMGLFRIQGQDPIGQGLIWGDKCRNLL